MFVCCAPLHLVSLDVPVFFLHSRLKYISYVCFFPLRGDAFGIPIGILHLTNICKAPIPCKARQLKKNGRKKRSEWAGETAQ